MAFLHPTALLIDDDVAGRDGVAELLRGSGYEVATADHGREAMDKLYAGALPCIIVLDLNMPEMTGFEFRHEQRANVGFRDIPIIVYSAVQDPEQIAGYLDAMAYVQKPAVSDDLIALIRQHCLK